MASIEQGKLTKKEKTRNHIKFLGNMQDYNDNFDRISDACLWWVAALMDTLHITQSGVALLDTYEFHQIQIVNQYHSYSFLYRRIGERIFFLLLQVLTLHVRYKL